MNARTRKYTVLALIFALSFTFALSNARADLSFHATGANLDATTIIELKETASSATEQTGFFLDQLALNSVHSGNEEVKVKLYTNHQDMLQNTPASAAKEVSMLGYFNHSSHEIGVFAGGNVDEAKRILTHEIIHLELHSRLNGNVPAWVDEGLAEFLSRDTNALTSLRAAELPALVKYTLKTAADTNTDINLTDLLNLNHDNFYGTDQAVHYATAYALMAYILNTEGHRVLGNLVSSGNNAKDFFMTQIAKGDLEQFETNFKNWAIN